MQEQPQTIKGETSYPSIIDGFKDKVVVVLGGASGIGLETAKSFWEQGAKVHILGLMPVPKDVRESRSGAVGRYITNKLAEFKENMPEVKGAFPRHEVKFVNCDVSARVSPEVTERDGDYLAVQQCLKEVAKDNNGTIDVLVDSIGWRPQISPETLTPELRAKVLEVNAGYIPFIFKTIAPLMEQAENGGRIVVIGSTLPHGNSDPNAEAYAAAKAARLGAAATAINTLGPKGISVNIVSPGHVDNEAEREQLGVAEAAKVEQAAIGRRAVPTSLKGGDVASAILWYASDRGKYQTGEHLVGGSASKIMPTAHFIDRDTISAQAELISAFQRTSLEMLGNTQKDLSASQLELGRVQALLEAANLRIEGLVGVLAEHGIAQGADHRRDGMNIVAMRPTGTGAAHSNGGAKPPGRD